MKRRINTWWVLTTALLTLITTGSFADEADSGFLTDYSQLKPVAGTGIRMYTAPGAYTDLKNYTAVMIDQPEFVIADDSKYKGFKPDNAKAVADALRQQFTDAVSKNIAVVDKAGPGVLYVRIAASNVHLKKKSRGLLGYTPAGFIVTTAVASGQAMEQKVILQDMNLEMEVQDSQSQAVLVAIVDKIKTGKKAKASDSWAQEHTVRAFWANRFNCRLENSRKPESEWRNCEAKLP
jgi:ABC-type amino acid transport substrate-binding protein